MVNLTFRSYAARESGLVEDPGSQLCRETVPQGTTKIYLAAATYVELRRPGTKLLMVLLAAHEEAPQATLSSPSLFSPASMAPEPPSVPAAQIHAPMMELENPPSADNVQVPALQTEVPAPLLALVRGG